MADPLIILDCMVFWFYPWFHAPVLLVAMGFSLAGAAVQLFLLRRTGKARWFPLQHHTGPWHLELHRLWRCGALCLVRYADWVAGQLGL